MIVRGAIKESGLADDNNKGLCHINRVLIEWCQGRIPTVIVTCGCLIGIISCVLLNAPKKAPIAHVISQPARLIRVPERLGRNCPQLKPEFIQGQQSVTHRIYGA